MEDRLARFELAVVHARGKLFARRIVERAEQQAFAQMPD
jgi:hypothetical protein